MFFDLRFALRQLSRNPGFTAVAVLTLALGIGANTAIFSVVNSVLLESLPYPEPERLVEVFETRPDGGRNSVAGGAFKDWHEHGTRFSHLAVYEFTRRNLTGSGDPQHVPGLLVSTEFLPTLGVAPTLGRDFAAGEDAVGGNNRVVILTHKLWQSRYGGDMEILGQTLALDQISHTIIGVLPVGALLHDEARFLAPTVIDDDPERWTRSGHWRVVIGRLLPGAAWSDAQTELRAVKQRLDYPNFKDDWSVGVAPLREAYSGGVRPTLRVLLGTVALVLLIACANVSNLLLARGNTRTREMAIRASLGAHSSRIIRQVMLESLLLALAGCGLGLLMAMFGVELLADMVGGQLPQALHPKLDLTVLMFSILAACGSGLLFGVLPAWRASRPDLNHDLKESERGSTSVSKRRSQSFLVVAEFALTVVLLIGAGLFLRSFLLLLDADPGFDPNQTLAFDLAFPEAKYPEAADRMAFIDDLRGRLDALPGVESVGAASALPLSDSGRTEWASRVDDPERTDYVVQCNFTSGEYFATMGIRLLTGREITAQNGVTQDGDLIRELVIDSSIARDLYPGEDPVGQRLRLMGEAWEIVGISAPVRHFVMHIDPTPAVYMAQAHSPNETSLVLRSSLPPLGLTEAVRQTVLSADSDQPIANVRTLEQAVHRSLATQRTTLILLGLFAAVAVSLACIGIYGVMSYAIGQRSRELCIRSVFGAQRRDILRLVISGGLKPSLVGIAIGLVVTLGLARVLDNLLFEVKTHDPLVFLGAVGLLTLMALVSIHIPARRAANANLIQSLRND